jgi:phage gp36-like protein
MAAYTTEAKLAAYVQPDMIVQAVDDDADDAADSGLFATVLAAVQAEIDGALGGVYDTPFAVVPAAIEHAANILCAEALWIRRGATRDTNPFAEHAKGRKQLRLEYWYRELRKKHGILMDGDQPVGGQWNFDADNRESFGKTGGGFGNDQTR